MDVLARDELAAKVADALWPRRYVGNLSEDDWRRVYAVVDVLDSQHRGAVDRAEWFRLRWALANGCTVEDAERAYERDVKFRRSMDADVGGGKGVSL